LSLDDKPNILLKTLSNNNTPVFPSFYNIPRPIHSMYEGKLKESYNSSMKVSWP